MAQKKSLLNINGQTVEISKTPSILNRTATLKRLEKIGDLFAPILKLKQKVPTVKAAVAS